MILIFDMKAIASIFPAIMIWAALYSEEIIDNNNDGILFFAMGALWVLMDVIVILLHKYQENPGGGHLYYIPVWVIGLIFMAIGLSMIFGEIFCYACCITIVAILVMAALGKGMEMKENKQKRVDEQMHRVQKMYSPSSDIGSSGISGLPLRVTSSAYSREPHNIQSRQQQEAVPIPSIPDPIPDRITRPEPIPPPSWAPPSDAPEPPGATPPGTGMPPPPPDGRVVRKKVVKKVVRKPATTTGPAPVGSVPAVTRKRCPGCSQILEIDTPERPLVIECPACGNSYRLTK